GSVRRLDLIKNENTTVIVDKTDSGHMFLIARRPLQFPQSCWPAAMRKMRHGNNRKDKIASSLSKEASLLAKPHLRRRLMSPRYLSPAALLLRHTRAAKPPNRHNKDRSQTLEPPATCFRRRWLRRSCGRGGRS